MAIEQSALINPPVSFVDGAMRHLGIVRLSRNTGVPSPQEPLLRDKRGLNMNGVEIAEKRCPPRLSIDVLSAGKCNRKW